MWLGGVDFYAENDDSEMSLSAMFDMYDEEVEFEDMFNPKRRRSTSVNIKPSEPTMPGGIPHVLETKEDAMGNQHLQNSQSPLIETDGPESDPIPSKKKDSPLARYVNSNLAGNL